MSVLVFHPEHNLRGRRDVTGAFQPEATRFARLYGGAIVTIDNRKSFAGRRADVMAALAAPWTLDIEAVAFFCHGWKRGLQLGFKLEHVDELAQALARILPRNAVVPLYACSAGSAPRWIAGALNGSTGGDGGFADALRDALCRHGADRCVVDAHTTVGHTTRNPRVRRFLGRGRPFGAKGGSWLIDPASPHWRAWRRSLRAPWQPGSPPSAQPIRYRFPFMTGLEITRELER